MKNEFLNVGNPKPWYFYLVAYVICAILRNYTISSVDYLESNFITRIIIVIVYYLIVIKLSEIFYYNKKQYEKRIK
tara:strand:+ start:718 stop:945 length:228 start_codon:yes stop_codon:yes gene_type:complete